MRENYREFVRQRDKAVKGGFVFSGPIQLKENYFESGSCSQHQKRRSESDECKGETNSKIGSQFGKCKQGQLNHR